MKCFDLKGSSSVTKDFVTDEDPQGQNHFTKSSSLLCICLITTQVHSTP